MSAAILICAPAGCSNGKSSSSSEAENSAAGETVEETTKPAPEIDKTGTKIYWRMDYKTDNVTATFINSTTGEKKEAGLEVVDETDEYRTYACWGDADKYNKVCFTYNEKSTKEVAFNKLVSGWHNSSHYGIVPYTEGGDDSESVYETKKFNCMGYEKEVYVWTPKDYDANSKDKYSVIYLLDGQNMLNRKTGDSGSWDVGKSVESMMAQSGNKAIIVAIATPEYTRNSELVPDFGEPATEKEKYDKREGIPFADFVVKTVVPYIEQNYKHEIRLKTLADIAGMSSSAFSRFFKLHTGRNLSEYIIDQRLGYASRLLVDSTNSIAEISYQCGFNNLSNFNRIFKKRKGCSPSEFRENYHKTRIIV